MDRLLPADFKKKFALFQINKTPEHWEIEECTSQIVITLIWDARSARGQYFAEPQAVSKPRKTRSKYTEKPEITIKTEHPDELCYSATDPKPKLGDELKSLGQRPTYMKGINHVLSTEEFERRLNKYAYDLERYNQIVDLNDIEFYKRRYSYRMTRLNNWHLRYKESKHVYQMKLQAWQQARSNTPYSSTATSTTVSTNDISTPTPNTQSVSRPPTILATTDSTQKSSLTSGIQPDRYPSRKAATQAPGNKKSSKRPLDDAALNVATKKKKVDPKESEQHNEPHPVNKVTHTTPVRKTSSLSTTKSVKKVKSSKDISSPAQATGSTKKKKKSPVRKSGKNKKSKKDSMLSVSNKISKTDSAVARKETSSEICTDANQTARQDDLNTGGSVNTVPIETTVSTKNSPLAVTEMENVRLNISGAEPPNKISKDNQDIGSKNPAEPCKEMSVSPSKKTIKEETDIIHSNPTKPSREKSPVAANKSSSLAFPWRIKSESEESLKFTGIASTCVSTRLLKEEIIDN